MTMCAICALFDLKREKRDDFKILKYIIMYCFRICINTILGLFKSDRNGLKRLSKRLINSIDILKSKNGFVSNLRKENKLKVDFSEV